ncbi:MAG: BspA family leucine-rich repeat surface protein [Oscillospiraceae bacterium]|nr:BspA family leucine-rich repeat surface protein [Oscillospiraceae bacterium]
MKKRMKRAAATLISLALLSTAMPFEAGTFSLPEITLTAQAAGSTAVFKESTGKLTLRGNVVKEDVQAFSMNSKVKSVYAEPGTVFPADCFQLFYGFCDATNFDLSNANTSKVTTMEEMFNSCESMETLNVIDWDTRSVTNLSWMFYRCQKLKNIPGIQSWHTDRVTTLEGMFYDCGITSLMLGPDEYNWDEYALGTWKTDSVTNYSMMFYHCFGLRSLSFINFTLKDDADTTDMFFSDSRLVHLNFAGNFEVKADMKLLNDPGWTIEVSSRFYGKISGDGTYAVIPAQFRRSSCTSLSEFTQIDHSMILSSTSENAIATTGERPYPGSIVVGTRNYVDEIYAADDYKVQPFTTDESHCGWYDTDKDRFVEKGEALQYGGSYIYIVRLTPQQGFYFAKPTPGQINEWIIAYRDKDSYFYDSDFRFLNTAAAHLNDDGTLDVYAVLLHPAKIKKNRYSNEFSDIDITGEKSSRWSLPEGTVYVNTYDRQAGSIFVQRLPEFSDHLVVTPTSIALGENVAEGTLTDDYLNYVSEGYEISIDGVHYKDLKKVIDQNEPFTGLEPATEYTLRVRLKGQETPFYTREVFTQTAAGQNRINLTFNHSVALNNRLGIAYYIPKSELEGYENVKLLIQKEHFNADGSERTLQSSEVTEYQIEDSGYGDEYVFVYQNIAAKEMVSEVYASISAEKDGKGYISQIDKYSVSTYAMNKLNKPDTKSGLKTLLVDMLNYGSAAQTYFNYNTGNPANSTLTAAQRKLGTNAFSLNITSDASETKISSPKAQFSGKNLLLGNNVALVFYMTFDKSVQKRNVMLKLSYTTVNGKTITKTVPFSQFVSGEFANEYRFDYSDVQAKDSCRPVTAVLYEGTQQISNEITYSVQTYAYNMLNKSSTSAKVKTIIYALMVYCKSAENYFRTES